MAKTYLDLTDEQKRALIHYHAIYGRAWKRRLRNDWMLATYPVGSDDSAVLQRMRNDPTLGPNWLVTFKMPSHEAAPLTFGGTDNWSR